MIPEKDLTVNQFESIQYWCLIIIESSICSLLTDQFYSIKASISLREGLSGNTLIIMPPELFPAHGDFQPKKEIRSNLKIAGSEVPAGTALSLQIRASDDYTNMGDWSEELYSSPVHVDEVVGDGKQYLQYRVNMETADPNVTPSLGRIELFWRDLGIGECNLNDLGMLSDKTQVCLLTGDYFIERLSNRSRMKGDFHVRFCESPRGRFPQATRPCLV